MCLWRCSLNQWRHCKIVLFCINALDLWFPWTMQQYMSTSKFFGGYLKYKDLLFLQRNGNSSHTIYGQLFNWKSTYSNLLTKAWATLGLFCSPCPHTPLKWDSSHFTTPYFDFYTQWSTAKDLATGICNTL